MTTACPAGCGGQALQVELEVETGGVEMVSCSSCDRRWWTRNGQPIAIDGLLSEISMQSFRRAG